MSKVFCETVLRKIGVRIRYFDPMIGAENAGPITNAT